MSAPALQLCLVCHEAPWVEGGVCSQSGSDLGDFIRLFLQKLVFLPFSHKLGEVIAGVTLLFQRKVSLTWEGTVSVTLCSCDRRGCGSSLTTVVPAQQLCLWGRESKCG